MRQILWLIKLQLLLYSVLITILLITEKAQGFVRVYNTLGTKRKELVTVELPQEYADFDLEVNDYRIKS